MIGPVTFDNCLRHEKVSSGDILRRADHVSSNDQERLERLTGRLGSAVMLLPVMLQALSRTINGKAQFLAC